MKDKDKPTPIYGYQIEGMDDKAKGIISRAGSGINPSDEDNEYLASQIRSQEEGNRNMFDSPRLQQELMKIKAGRK